MTHLKRWLVWLSRIHRSLGFGIQSPSDYSFVRNVVNEHSMYYAYDELQDDDWLVQKLGRLYFRLANWRQPCVMLSDKYQKYWLAGCRKLTFSDSIDRVELARITVEEQNAWEELLRKTDDDSVVVVEGIWRNPNSWKNMIADDKAMTTFDLYYCGIVLFETKRYKKHYTINF
jgi:hypothetical protein